MGFEVAHLPQPPPPRRQPACLPGPSASATTSAAATSTESSSRPPRRSSQPGLPTKEQITLLKMVKPHIFLTSQPVLEVEAFEEMVDRSFQAGYHASKRRGTFQGRTIAAWKGDGSKLGKFVTEQHRLAGDVHIQFWNMNEGGTLYDNDDDDVDDDLDFVDDDDDDDDDDEMVKPSFNFDMDTIAEDGLEYAFVEDIDEIRGWHEDTFFNQKDATHRLLQYFMLQNQRGGLYLKRGSACVMITVPPGCALLASKARRASSVESPPPCTPHAPHLSTHRLCAVPLGSGCSRMSSMLTPPADAPFPSCQRWACRSCPRR